MQALNGRPIHNLQGFVKIAREELNGDGKFLNFDLTKCDSKGETRQTAIPDIILNRSKVLQANKEICEVHGIPALVSSNLKAAWGS